MENHIHDYFNSSVECLISEIDATLKKLAPHAAYRLEGELNTFFKLRIKLYPSENLPFVTIPKFVEKGIEIAYLQFDVKYDEISTKEYYIKLKWFAVHKSLQQQGMGSILISYFKKMLVNIDGISTIIVQPSHTGNNIQVADEEISEPIINYIFNIIPKVPKRSPKDFYLKNGFEISEHDTQSLSMFYDI